MPSKRYGIFICSRAKQILMKTIAIMQPVYLPWLGYFEQMAVCDEFMFLDDVQYTKADWRNRNQIKKKDGSMWLTVPIVRGNLEAKLSDIEINYQTNWAAKQLNALKSNYAHAPYFEQVFRFMEETFDERPKRLLDLTIPLAQLLAKQLCIETPIFFASQIDKNTDNRMDRIIELCHARNADIIYTGPAAKAHIREDYLNSKRIQIIYQNYTHPIYQQQFDGFNTHMSVIDLMMNEGPKSHDILLSSPLVRELRK